jgi:hypothetical protein
MLYAMIKQATEVSNDERSVLKYGLYKCRVVATLLAGFALLLAAPNQASALYKLDELVPWEDGTVPVCWAPGINPESHHPKRIRQWVEDTWAKNANVTFTGWGMTGWARPSRG